MACIRLGALPLLALTAGLVLGACQDDTDKGTESDDGGGGAAGGHSDDDDDAGRDLGSAGGPSGGDGKEQVEPAENDWFRVSHSHVHFDSTNEEERVEVEIESFRPDLRLFATAVSPGVLDEPEAVVDHVSLAQTGTSTAVARIYREHLGRDLNPGTFRGQVRIRGCVDDECKDIYIDVTYEVVRLLLEGYSNTDNSDYQLSPLELRQILGHDSESSLVVPLRMSDGRDFTWTAEFRSPLDSVDWLTFTASGNQDEPLVLSLLEELDSLGYRSTSISISTEIDSIDAFFRYEAVPPLEVSATELHFSAPAGTAPEPQTIKVWDADGQQYDWEIRIGHFSGAGCPGSAQPEIEFLEGGPDVLPAVFQVTPPVFPEPGQCRATLEIIPDKFIDMVFHHVRMSYEITE